MGRKISLGLTVAVSFLVVGSGSMVLANSTLPACAPGNLAGYQTQTANPPAAGGCAIGILDYYNFNYVNPVNAPLASGIGVSPDAAGFSFGPLSNTSNSVETFEIDYDMVIDPAPVVTGDNMHLDVSGNIEVEEFFCNDSQYIGNGLCLGSIPAQSLTVGYGTVNGIDFGTTNTDASIVFPTPVNVSQEVGIQFTLEPNSSFEGLDSNSVVLSLAPEPTSLGFALLGLVSLSGYQIRKRSKR